MRALISLMLMGSQIAQKSVQDNQQFPQPIIPFELTYDELPELITCVSGHLLEKYKMIPEDQIDEYNTLIEYGIQMILFKPKVKSCIKKNCSCLPCFKV